MSCFYLVTDQAAGSSDSIGLLQVKRLRSPNHIEQMMTVQRVRAVIQRGKVGGKVREPTV